MGERRILPSIRLQEELAFADARYALRMKGEQGMAAQQETVTVGNHLPPISNLPRRFVPCRERSLHAFVKRRSLRGRRYAGRLAGFNNGRNVTYYD